MGTILIDKLLQACVKQGASDIHMAVGQPPVFRLHGRMRQARDQDAGSRGHDCVDEEHHAGSMPARVAGGGGTDFGFAFGELARFRVSVFKQRGNIGMVLRQIPNTMLTMEQLGLPPRVADLCMRPRGLFLVTGPTGSGKSTTLASMINYINETVDHHIITIEDPIEFYHYTRSPPSTSAKWAWTCRRFAEAIRRALRQDPDVILVGELRDLETIEAAITAAETGHVVFGTLHTNSAQGTINRIIDVFPTTQQDQIRTQLSVSIIGMSGARTLFPGLAAAAWPPTNYWSSRPVLPT